MPDYLTAPERETVIITSDAGGGWVLTTHQRKVITKLRNAGWDPVEDLHYHGQPGYRFEIPVNALSFRSRASVERVLTPEEREARAKQGRALYERFQNASHDDEQDAS